MENNQKSLALSLLGRAIRQAELEANQMNRFDCRLEIIDKKPAPKLKVKNGRIVFKTKELYVVINTKTGLVDRYRVNGCDYLNKKAFEPLIIGDDDNSWGENVYSFRKVVGRFRLMSKKEGTAFSGLSGTPIDSVRVIEDGPARSKMRQDVFNNGQQGLFFMLRLALEGVAPKWWWSSLLASAREPPGRRRLPRSHAPRPRRERTGPI